MILEITFGSGLGIITLLIEFGIIIFCIRNNNALLKELKRKDHSIVAWTSSSEKFKEMYSKSEVEKFDLSQQKQELEKQVNQSEKELAEQISDNIKLKKIKRKYEFIQSTKPKYNIGDKFGTIEIIKLDVKLGSFFNIAANVFLHFITGFLFKSGFKNGNGASCFIYIIKDMSLQEPEEETVKESFLDELLAKQPKTKKIAKK